MAQLEELDSQIATLASGIRDSIRGQYLTAMRQEVALGGNVGRLKGQTLSEQDRSVRFNILKREVDTNRQLYDGLLQRFKELSAQAGVTSNNVSVVDKAALRRLLATRAEVIGAVLTKFEARKVGYGDDYGYYSYSYGGVTAR